MRPSAGDEDASDGGCAAAAGLAGALIHAVLDLERAGVSVGVDVIGDRRATQADGVTKNVKEGEAETFELGAGKAAGAAGGADAGAEEALVGVNVAYTSEQRLIKKGCLDGQAPAAEESGEGLRRDLERLGSRRDELLSAGEVAKLEAAEAARIDEAQLVSAGQGEADMGVAGEGGAGFFHQQLAGHAQVDDPLSVWKCLPWLSGGVELEDDVLAAAMDGEDAGSLEALGLAGGRRFEGLTMAAEPGLGDSVAAQAHIHAAGDGFDFGELGHRLVRRGPVKVRP
jgi:hypothetical protein